MSSIKPEVLRGWGPGGWIYYQPETNWWAPLPLANSFDAQVANIIAMRQANPRFNLATDPAAVAADLEAYTIARWSKKYSRNGMERFLAGTPASPLDEAKKKESSTIALARRAANAAAGLAGIDISSLEEWLGEGANPVSRSLAEARAEVCANCGANQRTGWRRLFTVPAAASILRYIEAKHVAKLYTSFDHRLGSCKACKCVLELKVWQPIEFIRDNIDGETIEKHKAANESCWVLKEL